MFIPCRMTVSKDKVILWRTGPQGRVVLDEIENHDIKTPVDLFDLVDSSYLFEQLPGSLVSIKVMNLLGTELELVSETREEYDHPTDITLDLIQWLGSPEVPVFMTFDAMMESAKEYIIDEFTFFQAGKEFYTYQSDLTYPILVALASCENPFQLEAQKRKLDIDLRVSPSEGGCWFCHRANEPLKYGPEVNTNVHTACIVAALQMEHNNPEACAMKSLEPEGANEFK